jgi:hypothetical protein
MTLTSLSDLGQWSADAGRELRRLREGRTDFENEIGLGRAVLCVVDGVLFEKKWGRNQFRPRSLQSGCRAVKADHLRLGRAPTSLISDASALSCALVWEETTDWCTAFFVWCTTLSDLAACTTFTDLCDFL